MRKFEQLICGVALAASALFAQGPVRLNVTAADGSGQAVEDLNAADFQITDQGKPEKIVFFRKNANVGAAQLAPHEYSNRTAAAPHATVILFDLLNENQTDRLDAWHKIGKSLQQLESGESVYLYLLTLEGTLSPIHGMGKAGAKSGDDKTWTQQIEKVLDKAMKAASHASPVQMSDQELVVKKTYVALEALGTQLAMYPGERDILWITSATPNVWNTKNPCSGDWVDCALYVPHLAVTLAAANVAVNPLTYTGSPSPDLNRDMENVAGLTGGSSFFSQDIRSVLKDLSRDAASSYSIFYDPAEENWDSKFHKVHIATERKGLKLRVKQRYYALPDKRPQPARQQPVLAAAFQSASDDPSIGLRVTASPNADAAKGVHLDIRIDASNLMLRDEGGNLTGGITYLVADMGASGPVGDPMINGSNLKLTHEQFATALKEGFPLPVDHAANAAAQKLRIIVLDQGSNIAGSLTIPAR